MLMHASTIRSRTAADILAHITNLSAQHACNAPLLFALSASTRAADLSALVTHIARSWPNSLGCLSSSSSSSSDTLSCALAVLDPARCVPFRSTLAGVPAPQVGRWHAARRKTPADYAGKDVALEADVDWEALWSRRSEDPDGSLLPELQHLAPQEVSSVIYMSDSAPEGLSNALRRFTSATKLGLYASSTPFITGRPVTLMRGGDIFSSGAVGFALTGPPPTSSLDVPNMHPLTETMSVSLAEGNLIQQLDGKNPAALLLHAMRAISIDKQPSMDDGLYVGLVDSDTQQPGRFYLITSGDPSRGTLALESGDAVAPAAGSTVRIYQRRDGMTATTPATNERSVAFAVVADDLPSTDNQRLASETTVHDGFFAGSENGFTLEGPGDKDAWSCRVPGATVELQWPAERYK